MSCQGSLATSDLMSGHRRSWLATTSGRTAISRALLRRRHSRRRRVEHDRDARHAGGRRPITPPPALVGVETERVDDGGELATEPAGDDVVEQGEGVGGCGEVVLALTDERAQRVARNDLRRLEPLLRPRRLAGRDRPDEHDHAG